MAKKAPVGEAPYRPISENLIRSVLAPQPVVEEPAEPAPPVPKRPEVAAKNRPDAEQRAAPALRVHEPEVVAPELRPVSAPRRPQRLPTKPREDTLLQARKLDREKRMLLTQDEERVVDRFVSELGSELGAAIKLSHVLRACVLLVRNAEPHILERARASPRLVRPANGDVTALGDFEREVARVLAAAFRDAPALK